ncbi:MAG: chemotaxis protein CheW [Bdellovibrionota bacterium]
MPTPARLPETAENEHRVFLLLTLRKAEFLLPFDQVREVAEFHGLRIYPRESPGHLGLISLRGNVVPVLSVGSIAKEDDQEKCSARRIVVLAGPDEQVFAILASSLKKVALKETDLASEGTLSIEGRPVQRIDSRQILEQAGVKVA